VLTNAKSQQRFWGFVPEKLKQFADMVYRFLCRIDKNLKISQKIPLILDHYVSRRGLSDVFGGATQPLANVCQVDTN